MENKKTPVAERYPILISLAVTAVFLAVLMSAAFALLLIPGFLKWDEYAAQLLVELLGTALGVGLILLTGQRSVFRERRCGFFRGLYTGMYLVAAILLTTAVQLTSAVAAGTSPKPPLLILAFLLTVFLIGAAEEFVFRGLIAGIILKKYGRDPAGVWFSVFISGAIFGAMHMANAVTLGTPASVAVQALVASVLGMAITAVYYRTRNLWVVVALHAAIDFASLLPSGLFAGGASIAGTIGSYSALNLVGVFPYLIFTCVLLRPEKMREITGSAEPSSKGSKRRAAAAGLGLLAVFIFAAALLIPQTLSSLPPLGGRVICSFSGTFPKGTVIPVEVEERSKSTVTAIVGDTGGRVIDVIFSDESGRVRMQRISADGFTCTETPETPAGTYRLEVVILDSPEQLRQHIEERGYRLEDKELASLCASLDALDADWPGVRVSFKMTAKPM